MSESKTTTLIITDSEIREMKHTTVREMAPCLQAQGGTVTVSDSLFRDGGVAGIIAYKDETHLDMSRSLVRDIVPNTDKQQATGVMVSQGASADIRECLLEEIPAVGLAVGDPGTLATIHHSVVRNILIPEDSGMGIGVLVDEGTADNKGCLIENFPRTGVVIVEGGGKSDISGTIIRSPSPAPYDLFGMGLLVSPGGQANLSSCLLTDLRTIGILAHDTGATITADEIAIQRTRAGAGLTSWGGDDPAQAVPFGDGIQIIDGATLTVSHSIVSASERNGTYFQKASGTLSETLITGSNSFGLALVDSDESTDYSQRMAFYDNGTQWGSGPDYDIAIDPDEQAGVKPPDIGDLPEPAEYASGLDDDD